MATVVGSGMLLFTPVENWEKLPSGWEFIDVAGVAVDSKRLFAKYQAASRLSIKRVIATYTNVSLVVGNSS